MPVGEEVLAVPWEEWGPLGGDRTLELSPPTHVSPPLVPQRHWQNPGAVAKHPSHWLWLHQSPVLALETQVPVSPWEGRGHVSLGARLIPNTLPLPVPAGAHVWSACLPCSSPAPVGGGVRGWFPPAWSRDTATEQDHTAWDGGSVLVAPVLMLEVWETLGAS